MAVAIQDAAVNTYYHNIFKSLLATQRCKRRVFVQTDSGSVLGIELERTDNVRTVKKKMQIALNVPTEATALTFGDMVLKNNDLSAVRNHAPLRLTRTHFQRSSSTPCFLAVREGQEPGDKSKAVEILGGLNHDPQTEKLIAEAVKGVECSMDPVPVKGGLGGAYYLRNTRGESIAIVKPTDEEPLAPNNPKGFVGKALGQPGLKGSVRVGETGIREVAAYLLDHENFSKVPPTVLVKISHSIFHVNNKVPANKHQKKSQAISKIASFQQFVPHNFDASDHGPSSFSVAAVHRIGILDVRILNTDRHAGNILVKKYDRDFGKFMQVGMSDELIPIDHGLSLPEILDDPYFEWLHWPQASVPFSEYELGYINRLDPVRDADLLKSELPMLRESSLRILVLCTILLKRAATAGLTLAEIGEIMSRGYNSLDGELSSLEMTCMQAKAELDQQRFFTDSEKFLELNNDEDYSANQFDLDMDYDGKVGCCLCPEDERTQWRCSSPRTVIGFSQLKIGTLHFLDEEAEEETVESSVLQTPPQSVGFSGRNNNLNQCFPSHVGLRKRLSRQGLLAQGNANCIGFPDTTEEEWALFLQYFEALLPEVFKERKNMRLNQRQESLGISCQF